MNTYRNKDNCRCIVSSWAKIIFIRRSLPIQRDNFGCSVLACANHCDDLCLRRRNFALRALPTGLPIPLSLSVEINDDNCGVVLLMYTAGAGPKWRNNNSHCGLNRIKIKRKINKKEGKIRKKSKDHK